MYSYWRKKVTSKLEIFTKIQTTVTLRKIIQIKQFYFHLEEVCPSRCCHLKYILYVSLSPIIKISTTVIKKCKLWHSVEIYLIHLYVITIKFTFLLTNEKRTCQCNVSSQ